MNLFAIKPMKALLSEAHESGKHSLKRTLGPFQLTALGVGAVIGAGIFVLTGLGAQYAGPGLMLSFVLSGAGCAFAGLCYAEFAAMIPLAGSAYTYAYATLGELFAWIIGWDLTLEYAMGASTVSSGWSNHFIEMLNIFHIKMPLWLAYDHWTALRTAENIVARQMAQAADPSLAPGTQAFLNRVADVVAAHSPELMRRAAELLNAPEIFGVPIGFNLPAFIIALVVTAILVVKVSVVLFVVAMGFKYVNTANWGTSWSTFAPNGFSGIGAGAAYIFFAYIGFDAVSTTAQEAKNPQRDLPIGIIGRKIAGRSAGRRTHRNGSLARDQHGSAYRARLSGPRADRGVTCDYFRRIGRPDQRHAGDAAGPNARALLHGKRRAAAKTFLRGHPSEVQDALEEHDPGRDHSCRGGKLNAYRRYWQDGQHRHAARVCHRVHRRDGAAQDQPGAGEAVSDSLGAAGSDSRYLFQRIYDVQAGMDQLGPADRVAGDRTGRLLQLWPLS